MKPELALLVDGDQSGADLLVARLAVLERDWLVTARICVRNWRSSTDQAAWDVAARDARMECIQHAPEKRGKNATDIELTIRAMDLLHGSGYRAFCILSGDSDFLPLARRLERAGAHVMLETLNVKGPAKAVAPKPSPTVKAATPTKGKAPAPKPAAAKKQETLADLVRSTPATKAGPDSAGFARVLRKAFEDCSLAGKAPGGVVPLVLLSSAIPTGSKKEDFGYPRRRSMLEIVRTLPEFAVIELAAGQHAVKRQ